MSLVDNLASCCYGQEVRISSVSTLAANTNLGVSLGRAFDYIWGSLSLNVLNSSFNAGVVLNKMLSLLIAEVLVAVARLFPNLERSVWP